MYVLTPHLAQHFRMFFVGDRVRFPALHFKDRVAYTANGKLANGWFRPERNGPLRHYVNGLMHDCEDGPAVISERYVAHFQKGKLHNENGPAQIDINGTTVWAIRGKRMSFDSISTHHRLSASTKMKLLLAWAPSMGGK